MARTAEDVLCLGDIPVFNSPGELSSLGNKYLEQIHQNKNLFHEIAHQHSPEGTDSQQLDCLCLLSKLARFSQQCIDLAQLVHTYVESEEVSSYPTENKIKCLRLLHRCQMIVETGLRSSERDPLDNSAVDPHRVAIRGRTGCSFEDFYRTGESRELSLKDRYSKSWT